ncbi:MAG: hypothetical protein Q4Q03_02250 [Bowdeniella nasicola]|nr:hypothetical protein [Bowdeniella nasicola]
MTDKLPTPDGYAQDPATAIGPSCGLEWFETPPAMPTEYDFTMSDGSVQTLPVKVVRQPRDQAVDNAEWNKRVASRLTADRPWGEESATTSFNLIVDKPGDPADGFKGEKFTLKRHRLLITDQEDVNIAVELGEEPTLPSAIDITYKGQKTCQNAETEGSKSSPITWDDLTDEQRDLLATPGATFTINGTVNTTVPGSDTPVTWPRTSDNKYYGYTATATITVGDAKPVGYAQDPATAIGPSCGLEWFETPPAMPTEYDFTMSDGSVQTLPVKVVRQPRDQAVDNAEWNKRVASRLTADRPWGEESATTSFNLIVDKPGDPADGFKGEKFTLKRHRLLITDQEDVNIAVELGEEPTLPSAIDITYKGQKTCQNAETEGSKSSPITWDDLTDEQRDLLATPGATFTINGTVNTTVPGSDTPVTWPRTSDNKYYGYTATATITVGDATPDPEPGEPTEPEPTPEPVETDDPTDPDHEASESPVEDGEPAKPLPGDTALPHTGADGVLPLVIASLFGLGGAMLVLLGRQNREA